MAHRSSLEAERALHALALEQGGLVTAKQAAAFGYRSPHLAYHVRTGRLKRVRHGIYRLAAVPMSEHDELIELALWSRNRAGEPYAVVSHVSALVVHGVTDLMPAKVHLTVPRSFKKRAPPVCVLHRANLEQPDWEPRVGFSVTTPMRTLLDTALDPSVPALEFEKSVQRALELGLVRRAALAEAADARTEGDRLRVALEVIQSQRR